MSTDVQQLDPSLDPQPEIPDRRAAWLAERRTGLGASDSAAALGESPWKSAYALWAEKAGMVEEQDLSEVEAVEWGQRLEKVVKVAYKEKTGREVRAWPSYMVRRHKSHKWLLATPDALQVDEQGRKGLLQIKTTGAFNLKEWLDEAPLMYQIQLQHELLVTGRPWGTLVCLVGGQKLVWLDFERNDRFCEALVQQLSIFWNHVLRKQPPPVDGSESCRSVLARLHPKDNGQVVDLPPEAAEWSSRLAEVKTIQKALEEERSLLENRVKEAIGENTMGRLATGGGFSWKHQTTHHPAKEAYESEFRVLRAYKEKGRE